MKKFVEFLRHPRLPWVTPANAESIAFWNDDAGPRWAKHAEAIDVQLESFLGPIAREASLAPGSRVLDVGCGAGALALRLASVVSPGGRVDGVDLSRDLLALAVERVSASGLTGIDLRRADAQTETFAPGAYDAVVSRFGVMFFEDSLAAFRNLRTALRPGGRFSFVCWAEPERNPWMGLPREVVARHLEMPGKSDDDEPGPFRFHDPARIRELCREAGFDAVSVEPLEGRLILGGLGSLDDAVKFLLEVGPAAQARNADTATLRAVVRDLRETLAAHAGSRGVELGYRAWLTGATAP